MDAAGGGDATGAGDSRRTVDEIHHDILEAMWTNGETAADPQTLGNAASSLAREAYLHGDYARGLAWSERGRIAWGGTWGACELAFEARLALHVGDARRLAELRDALEAQRGRRAILAELAMVEAAAAALAGRRDDAISGYRVALDRYREYPPEGPDAAGALADDLWDEPEPEAPVATLDAPSHGVSDEAPVADDAGAPKPEAEPAPPWRDGKPG
jgi:hypothetical protein